jgi:hypothetical protein
VTSPSWNFLACAEKCSNILFCALEVLRNLLIENLGLECKVNSLSKNLDEIRIELRSEFEHKRHDRVETWEQQLAKVYLLILRNHTLIILTIKNWTHHKRQCLTQSLNECRCQLKCLCDALVLV